MRKLFVCLAIAMLACGIAVAKKATVLNVEKGELPNDSSEGMKCNLSEEQAFTKGGVSLKIEAPKYPAVEFWVGEYGPKKGVWDGFDYLRFEIYSTSKNPQGLRLTVKPPASTYQTRMDQPIMVRPGKSVVEIELAGACANDGSAIDWKKKVQQWDLSGTLDAPIYIGNIYLMTADEIEKLDGGGDDKPAKKDDKKEEKKK